MCLTNRLTKKTNLEYVKENRLISGVKYENQRTSKPLMGKHQGVRNF